MQVRVVSQVRFVTTRLVAPRCRIVMAAVSTASSVMALDVIALMLLCGFVAGSLTSAARAQDVVPPQPSEPVAAKAYGVFDQACAGCHQAGKLKAAAKQPAGGLANILDLDTLARNPALVTPGNPDASPLYTSIQSRAMPVEMPGEPVSAEVTATELASVREWIDQLPPVGGCGDRQRLTGAAVADAVARTVLALDAKRAATTRFISLAPLYNGCASIDDMEGARQAVAQLLNMLSTALEPMKPRAFGPDGVLLEIDLVAIGWTAATWDGLAQRAPAAVFVPFDDKTRKATATETPLVSADWLADTALRAPLYYDLLGLPDTLPGMLASLKLDLSNQKRGAADRIGIRTSQVARGNRQIERRVFANGSAWLSSEFAPTAGRPDMFDLTVAANATVASGPARPQPFVQADATLMHFDLPNGFPAFFAANPAGARVADLPLSMLKDDSHPSSKVTVGHSCVGCHSAGGIALARGRTDDLKARLQAEPTLSKEARERLLALHSEPADLQRRIDEDHTRFLRAAAAAGVDPARRVAGLEALPALAARYRRDVSVAEFADLVDVDPKTLNELGRGASATLVDVIERLGFGAVPRGEVDAMMPELAVRRGLRAAASAGVAVPAIAPSVEVAPLMRLVLKVERPTFQSGDLLTLTARTNAGCYLTVLTVDARGRGTVLYPNEFEPANFIEPGRDVRVPNEKAPYQFRLRDKGQETLIGICATTAKSVDGINHDFEKQRFTELGDYRAFLNRNWGLRDSNASNDGKGRSKVSRRTGDSAAVPDAAPKPDAQARSAIRITVQ